LVPRVENFVGVKIVFQNFEIDELMATIELPQSGIISIIVGVVALS